MWEAFGGYADIYGPRLPPARTVRRVALYLMARNRYQNEQQAESEAEVERQRAERETRVRLNGRG